MKWVNGVRALFCAAVTTTLLAACSGGGSDDGIDGTGFVEISGTAAIGAPIANASVSLKSGKGEKKSATTKSNGKFSLDATNLTGPFLLRTRLENGTAFYSYASGAGVANIHPFTDLVLRNWYKRKGLDINSEFDSGTAATQMPTQAEIDDIEEALKKSLELVLQQYGLSTTIDFFSTVFEANGTGFDNFLDHASVVIITQIVTIIVNDPSTGIDSVVVKDVNLNTDLTQNDGLAPEVPTGVRVIPASANELIVLWDASTDNVAVAGYNVYRQDKVNGTKTPFPVLSDTGLTANTEYCYEVEAYDAAGNVSARSTSACATTPDMNDGTPPAQPTQLQATALDSGTIALAWTAPADADVAGYNIYRGQSGAATTKIGSVTAVSFTDLYLSASSQYCYVVKAFDAAKNESAASNEACATTNAVNNQQPATGARQLEFSSAQYSVTESDSTALITVNRIGDGSEAVSVNYAVSNGTASAPGDFITATGTLSWAANDLAPKTFRVQIKGDTVADNGETIALSLSDASTNASVGPIANATLTIFDAPCTNVLSADINVDTTISTCTLVTKTIYIQNNATLTILPGVTMLFQSGTGFNVRTDGALTANGTADKPILFTGVQKTPGYWDGIQFTFSNNVNNSIDYAIVEFGGGLQNGTANVVTYGTINSPQRLKIKHTVLSDSSAYGIEFSDGAIIDAFEGNTMIRNGSEPVSTQANLIGKLDAQSRYSGNAKDQVRVVNGTAVNTDQTWNALDVPYAMGSHTINGALTIQAGAKFIFGANGRLNVATSGSLGALGTAEQPVIFTASQPTPGYWTGIQYTFSNSINNVLDHVVVEYGGGSGGNGNGNVVTYGTINSPQRLKLTNSVLRYSGSFGFDFSEGAIVDGFSSNSITLNTSGAGRTYPDVVRLLDSASSYSGNTVDAVAVETGNVTVSGTWPAINVPYDVNSVNVNNSQLTIAAPNTLLMRNNSRIYVNSAGSLTAIGSATAPIVFSSKNQTPGAWQGIQYTFSNSANNILNYVTVEYAGGSGLSGTGGVILYGSQLSKSGATITNSTFNSSSSYGIWLHHDAVYNLDVDTTNSFLGNALGNVYLEP